MSTYTDDIVETLAPHPDGSERTFREFGVSGLLLRVGQRKKKWELRIGDDKALRRVLGTFPQVKVAAAILTAQNMRKRHVAGLPIDAPTKDEHTIASTWPMFKKWLEGKGRSDKTLDAYQSAFNRLSDYIKAVPLAKLVDDRELMLHEQERIVADCHKRNPKLKRGGASAGTQSIVFVSALFAYLRDCLSFKLEGNPVSACVRVDPERDQPVLAVKDMPAWYAQVQEISNPIVKEALLFSLLTGLRRASLESLRWENLDLGNGSLHVDIAKGGKSFDLILTAPMIACLERARVAGQRLYPEHAAVWCFASEVGHLRAARLTKLGLVANHGLRRSYSTAARLAGVDEGVISQLLNHGARGLINRYVKASHLGKMLHGAQQDISAFIMQSLKPPALLAFTPAACLDGNALHSV
jgi:integrase